MTTEIRIVWDEAALHRLFRSPQGEVGRYLLGVANDVRTEAVRLSSYPRTAPAPYPGVRVWTGRLRASHTTHLATLRGTELAAIVANNVEYAQFVHQRRPWLATALSNVVGGRARRL